MYKKNNNLFCLKILQSAGVEGEQCVLLMEDYQFIESTFVELINSLLSAGEVPGLYTPDELEAILSPLREESSQENFRGTMVQYFAQSKNVYSTILTNEFF
jgi:dynein heavy chain 2